MYFEEIRSEKKNPLQLVIALAAAIMVNGALAATLVNGGIDNQVAKARTTVSSIVADLGTLPPVNVLACRVKV